MNSTRLRLLSARMISILGFAILRGIPGIPAPLPRSMRGEGRSMIRPGMIESI